MNIPTPSNPPRAKPGLLTIITIVIPVVVFPLAAWSLYRQLGTLNLGELKHAIAEIPRHRIVLALLMTVMSYAVITSYDGLILRFMRKNLAYYKSALTALISASISANIGFSVFTSGPLRLRLYTGYGLTPREIGKVIIFGMIMYWSGFASLAGIVFGLLPYSLPGDAFGISPTALRTAGVALLMVMSAYTALCLRRTRFTLRGHRLVLPVPSMAITQMMVATLDWMLIPVVFYLLLPETPAVTFLEVLQIALLAQCVGVFSNVPGGLGVFDSIALFLLGPRLGATDVAATLVVYRTIYYLLPFAVGLGALAVHELTSGRHPKNKTISHKDPS